MADIWPLQKMVKSRVAVLIHKSDKTNRWLNYLPELKVEDEDHTTSVFCVRVKHTVAVK